MSDINEQDDFFIKEAPHPKPAEPAPAGDSEGSKVRRLNGMHLLLAGVAAAFVWIGWSVFGGPSTGLGIGHAQDDPAATRYADSLEANPPSSGATPLPPIPLPSTGASSSPPAGATAVVADPEVLRQLDALREQVNSLSSALQSDMAQREGCKATPARTSVVRSSGQRRRESAVLNPAPRDLLPGYHLNTVYNGQAWIEKGGRTIVVEQGGELDGARVERIDALARVVQTSRGDVR